MEAIPLSASAQMQNQEYSACSAGDYMALLKPRVMLLVTFTGVIGMLAAPAASLAVPLIAQIIAVLCIALGAGASGAFNMWYERESDALMQRTKNRPLPTKRMHAGDALTFSVFLMAMSVALLGLATNWVAAFWLAFSIFFYCVIYTVLLKKRTPQNIVIGGASGAFPPVIGWAAITGNAFAVEPWLLFAIIFLWTPPHFWALALYRAKEYAAAGIPMLPVVKGERHTRLQIVLYSLVLVAVTLAYAALGYAGWVYFSVALITGGFFIYQANAVLLEKEYTQAKKLFGYSILYLFIIFTAIGLEKGMGMI